MPKTMKFRRQKTADFTKTKVKLGKGKLQPTNAVDTSFKTRSIMLAPQAITVEKSDSTPTTRRRLSLDDLLLHLKHHNAGVRKDAISGLKELFDEHPEVIEPGLTSVFKTCSKIIGDEDAAVRKALLNFFSWLLSRLPPSLLIPHGHMLLLSTASAQTSILPDIRIDAVQFLDLLLQFMPDQVVNGWITPGESGSSHSSRILDGYMSLLSAGKRFGDNGAATQSTVTIMLSPAYKAIVLKSLCTFIRHMTNQDQLSSASTSTSTSSIEQSLPSWYLASSFRTHDAFISFSRLLDPSSSQTRQQSSTVTWTEDVSAGDYIVSSNLALSKDVQGDILQSCSQLHALVASLSETDDGLDDGSSRPSSVLHSLCRAMQPILVSTFLECAPSVFSPSHGPPEAETEMIMAVGRIACGLYRSILANSALPTNLKVDAVNNLKDLLGHMAVYFPYRDTDNDPRTKPLFQELSIIYCELSSLLILASPPTSHPRNPLQSQNPSRRKNKADAFSTPELIARQRARIGSYVIRCLQATSTSRNVAVASASQASVILSPSTYVSLLPTVWSLLCDSDEETREGVLDAVCEHAMKTSSTGAMKRSTVEFVARLLLLQSDRYCVGGFRIDSSQKNDSRWREWVMQLPQTLWELGSSNMNTTEIIFLFLLRFLQRKPFMGGEDLILALRSRFIPYFFIRHPERGDRVGPYARLPQGAAARRLALDVVKMMVMVTGDADDLRQAVNKGVEGTAESTYWFQLCSS